MKIQEGYLTIESGSWLGHLSRWTVNAETGENKRRQIAFKLGAVSAMTKTAAREKLRERIVSELGLTADNRVTLGWFAEYRWKPTRESTWRDSTAQTNAELLKIITARFGATALEDMDAVEMQLWLAALAKERSGSAVKHLRIFLMSIMREAVDQHYLHSNPARSLRIPKGLKAVIRPWLTIPEIKKLIKQTVPWAPRENTLLSLIFTTALRPSELLALRWRCIDFKNATLTIEETVYRGVLRKFTKTTQEGDTDRITLTIPDTALIALAKWQELSNHCNDDDFIFCTDSGTFWWKENYQRRVLTPLAKDAKIGKVNFQILRRTVATHAQHLGSPKDIATIMRHKKIATAQDHYVQEIAATVKATTEKLAVKLLE